MKKRRSARPARQRPLLVEPLESRVVLDGNVRAFMSGGSLFLQGDSRNNEILVEQTAQRQFVVSSRDGSTTINGQTDARTFTRVRNNLDISLNRGNDVVEILGSSSDPVSVGNRLFINTGHGVDQVLLSEVHAIGLHIDTGSGNDTINIGNDGSDGGLEVTKEAVIVTGGGRDDARIANSLFKRFLVLDMGANNDQTTIQDTTFRKRSTVIGGGNSDTLNRENNTGKVKFISFERTNNSVQNPAPLPPVASNDTAAVTRGGNLAINVSANDSAPSSTLNVASIVITQAPTNGTAVANANGTVTYTNNGNAAGTDSFQYTIKNANGTTSNAATVSITVNAALVAVDDAASVTEDATPNTATGNVLTNDTGGTGTKTVTFVNGAAASVGQTINGQFGTFNIAANGAFNYTLNNSNTTVNALNAGQTLIDAMNYTVGDGSNTSDIGTLNVTIQGNSDVVAVDDTGMVTEDATPDTSFGNVLTNDTGGTGTKTVSSVNGATGSVGQVVNGQFGTFQINADGTYTYTLNNSNTTVNALNNGQTLTDTMNYAVTSGSSTDTGTLTITIQGTTELDAVNDTGTVTEDATANTATGNVLTNDTGGAGTKTVTTVNGAAGSVGQVVNGQFGTFQINADGTFTYTLNNSNATVNALNNGGTLTDTMNYTAGAGNATDTATLTITIQGTTELAAVNDTGTVTEDATPNTATGNVLTNDTGGAGTKTVTEVDGVAGNVATNVTGDHGTFRINADGTFTYTLNNADPDVNNLNNGQTLTDVITYEVTAGRATSTATLTITIQGANEATPVNGENDTGSLTEDATPNTVTGNVLGNDTGGGTKTVTQVDNGSASVGQNVPGSFGTFNIAADGSFTYTLDNSNTTIDAMNNGETQSDVITYTVGDGATTDTATLTITIPGHTDLAAEDDAANITEDADPNTVSGNVLDNETGGAATKTVTAVDGSGSSVGVDILGDHGTFRINANGTFIYTLNNADGEVNSLINGQTLTDTIGYTVSDGIVTDIAILTVTIQGVTD